MIRIDPYIQLQETLGSEKARAIAEFVDEIYVNQKQKTTTLSQTNQANKSVNTNAGALSSINPIRKAIWSSLDINALLMGVLNGLLIAIAYLYLKK